jgi:hypothetical protein
VNLVIQTSISLAGANPELRRYAAQSGMPIFLGLLFSAPAGGAGSAQANATGTALAGRAVVRGIELGYCGRPSWIRFRGTGGGGSGSKTYPLVVKATAGTLQHSLNVTLVVQK